MSARFLLPLLAFPLALAALPTHAAPAPVRRPEAAHPDVTLRGWINDDVASRAPRFIARQSDYESVAQAFGVANPPRVDFRTHFVFVHVCPNGSNTEPRIEAGDLRAVSLVPPSTGRGFRCGLRRAGASFLMKAYPRSAVKTVHGVPLPKG